ncbi:uncharacterized protein apof [Hoplias malabaricus]|uniref:uncharacterized protein apof n=1 Tax=Hoplias malabaricus TaxID=27720 RepID=UPI003461E750
MVTQTSKLKWLLLIYFMLFDTIHGRAPLTPGVKYTFWPIISTASVSPMSSPLPQLALKQETGQNQEGKYSEEDKVRVEEETRASSHRLISTLAASIQGHGHLHANVSCTELAAAPWSGEGFSQQLLSLVTVPVLVSAKCTKEAQTLVMDLYKQLGQDDTHELLVSIVALIKQSKNPPSQHSTLPRLNAYSQRHLQAVMFNIQQLAETGEHMGGLYGKDFIEQKKQCQGWLKVKGTQLHGKTSDLGEHLHLHEAKQVCESLGISCAGVSKDDASNPRIYRVILRHGSRVVPLASPSQSESWIQKCGVGPVRWRRHSTPQDSCKNYKEERVHNVAEWIPGVSTLYNLGTAVYYASVNCSTTAKERAILSAVDLGTDALMAVTGGTAGVAGYALGAGLKTGVKAGIKYLLNNMNQEDDLLLNQESWEDGMITIQ